VLSLYKQYAEKQMPEETDSDTEKIISKFYNMKQAGERYKEFAQKTKGKLITIGIPEVDKAIRGIYPGQVFGLMARAKTFKSAFMQNVAHRCAKQQRNVLIFSLEMPVISLFERSAQMEMDQSGDQIYSVFAGTSNSDFFSSDEIIDYVYKNAKGLYIVDQSRMSPKMMKDYIVVSEQELLNGERWDLIIVDFLQRVKEQGKSRIEVVGNIARNMKDLARDVDLPFIILIQISRSADKKEDGKERLNIASARDSGEIEEGVDYLAGMYRDNLSPNHIHFQLLANRQMKCEINPNPNDPNKDEIMLEISFPSLRMQTIWGNVEQGEKKVEVKVEKEKAHIPEEEYSDDDNDPVPF
jgi:replicative DNA helicase